MDRKKLAEECLEVERAGGSVREFLKERGCLSPWGTWYRLQIEELGRKDAQITEGKGDENLMKKITLEQKKKAVQIAIDGGDPLEYLANHGSKNPGGLWWTIRNDVKKADPELYAKIPRLDAVKHEKKNTVPVKVVAEIKPEIKVEVKPVEKKEIRPEDLRMAEPPKPITGISFPVEDVSGISLKTPKTMEFKITGINTEIGSFNIGNVNGENVIKWARSDSATDRVILKVDEWRGLADRLPKVLEVLEI